MSVDHCRTCGASLQRARFGRSHEFGSCLSYLKEKAARLEEFELAARPRISGLEQENALLTKALESLWNSGVRAQLREQLGEAVWARLEQSCDASSKQEK